MGSMVQTQQRESAGTRLYKGIVRPALFHASSDPERVHEIVSPLLRHSMPSAMLRRYLDFDSGRLSFPLRGIWLDGPVGLAAGFDKDAQLLQGLANIFDYVTFGTVIPYSWPGNPRTSPESPGARRIVRLEDEESMLNCLGFPFKGLDVVQEGLRRYSGTAPLNASIAVRPPKEGEDMDHVYSKFIGMLDGLSSYFSYNIKMAEANFASPNTEGLAVFFELGTFERFAGALIERNWWRQGFLLLLKMPPHLDDETKVRNIDVVRRWLELGGHGITVINTVRTPDTRLTVGSGGKSGRAIFEIMMANLADYREEFGMDIVINASGGISPELVPRVLIEGMADTVQVLTPFIFYGPTYVRDAKVALSKALDDIGMSSMAALRRAQRHREI